MHVTEGGLQVVESSELVVGHYPGHKIPGGPGQSGNHGLKRFRLNYWEMSYRS